MNESLVFQVMNAERIGDATELRLSFLGHAAEVRCIDLLRKKTCSIKFSCVGLQWFKTYCNSIADAVKHKQGGLFIEGIYTKDEKLLLQVTKDEIKVWFLSPYEPVEECLIIPGPFWVTPTEQQ